MLFLTSPRQVRQTGEPKTQGEWQSLPLLYGPSDGWIHSETRGCAAFMLKMSNLSCSGGVLSVPSHTWAHLVLLKNKSSVQFAVQWLWLPRFSICTRLTEPGLSMVNTWPLQVLPLNSQIISVAIRIYAGRTLLAVMLAKYADKWDTNRGINNFLKISPVTYPVLTALS